MSRPVLRKLLVLWLGWAIIMLAFQNIAGMRLQPDRPDNALEWIQFETEANSWAGRLNLLDPFLNEQVGWDSEFYISIATAGYDDPSLRAIPSDFDWGRFPNFCQAGSGADCYSLN
jgi:hypothetical protein